MVNVATVGLITALHGTNDGAPSVEISAVPVTDGYILWDTTNNIMYMGNGTRRLVFGVVALTAFDPLAYGSTPLRLLGRSDGYSASSPGRIEPDSGRSPIPAAIPL